MKFTTFSKPWILVGFPITIKFGAKPPQVLVRFDKEFNF